LSSVARGLSACCAFASTVLGSLELRTRKLCIPQNSDSLKSRYHFGQKPEMPPTQVRDVQEKARDTAAVGDVRHPLLHGLVSNGLSLLEQSEKRLWQSAPVVRLRVRLLVVWGPKSMPQDSEVTSENVTMFCPST
jgi:hypothetical protein